jgi:chloride channel 7
MLPGLFVPGILVGAAYGRLVGVFVRDVHPLIDESTYALLGSASYMAGSMRLVVSVSVMLLELTNQLSLLPRMMLVLVVAKAVADGSGVPGMYAIVTKMKGFPVLTPAPDKVLRHITAEDLVAHQGDPVTFQRIEQVAHILQKLRSCKHNGFPVLDSPSAPRCTAAMGEPLVSNGTTRSGTASPRGPSQLLGVVLRHHLLVLLRTGRAFQHAPVVTHNSQRIAFMHDITDFDKPVSSVAPTVDDVAVMLSTQALSMYIDLGPYVNPPSYIVQASTNAAQTYNLFQSLGLRHLCVVPDTNAVLGVITRKDLMPQHAAAVISNKVWTSSDNDDRGRESPSLDHSEALNTLQGLTVQTSGLSDSVGLHSLELQPRPGRVGVVRKSRQSPKER